MSHERLGPEDPREWLNRAQSNLVQCRLRQPGVYLEDLCFQCQQAAEKAVKALLVSHSRTFPYTHDISCLIAILEEAEITVPPEIQDVVILSRYAVATRNPGTIEPVSDSEYIEALELAEDTVRWVEQEITCVSLAVGTTDLTSLLATSP